MLLVDKHTAHIHGFLNVEIFLAAGALDHAAARLEQVRMLLPESKTADAVAVAGGHLDKAVAQLAVDDALERLDAVIQTVEEQIVAPGIERHGVQNAVRDCVAAREHRLIGRHIGIDGNAGLVHPVLQLRECNVVVGTDALKARRLLLLGDAGADVDNGRARVALAQQYGVRLHGREHRRQIRQRLRQVLFHIEHDRRTAGGDDRRIARLGGQLFKLLLDQIGTLRRLMCRCKAELFERLGDALKTGGVKIGDVGGVDAHNDLLAGCDQLLDLRNVADVLLGVLRADGHAVAAENTVARNDLCVTLVNADGLDRAEPDAFIAVFAVGLFETQNIHGVPAFL